jgi:hypothetical protein
MGAAEDAMDGYFQLWAFNYNKTELLQLLDEDELEAHQIMTRIVFNAKKEGIKRHLDWSRLRIDGEVHDTARIETMMSIPALSMDSFFREAVTTISPTFEGAKAAFTAAAALL